MATVEEKGEGKVQVFDSEEVVATHLAKYIADLSDKYVEKKGSFTLILSGGTLIDSPRILLELFIESVDWSKWYIFWQDERVVPKDHINSNYKLSCDGFISKVPIPPGNVYAINDTLSQQRVQLMITSLLSQMFG